MDIAMHIHWANYNKRVQSNLSNEQTQQKLWTCNDKNMSKITEYATNTQTIYLNENVKYDFVLTSLRLFYIGYICTHFCLTNDTKIIQATLIL